MFFLSHQKMLHSVAKPLLNLLDSEMKAVGTKLSVKAY